ncbi:MAG TPA: PEP/pyruvate-binding domain-containing protein, partial [Pirellulaceae bacterium]
MSTMIKSPRPRKPAASEGKAEKLTYYFGATRSEGRGQNKLLLGGKGANLAEMTGIGLPVPPGFTITTNVCHQYYQAGRKLPKALMDDVRKQISQLEKETGKRFGDRQNPLLVSVRSGAAVSMPGMMNTILNLGLNEISVQGLATATQNERFAFDAYRRLINMFGDVVLGVDHHHFETAFDEIKKKFRVTEDTQVPAEGLKLLCESYRRVFKKHSKQDFPQDPYQQLELAIE